eukprot:s526_g31.t1
MVRRGEAYQACPKCKVVYVAAQTLEHITECNGTARPPSKKTRKNRKKSAAFAEARQSFLQSAAADFKLSPFVIRCRDCPGECSFQKGKPEDSFEECLKAFSEHFKAVGPGAEAKEARELKQKTEALERRLEKEGKEADQKLEAAKQNSNQFISEQLAVNETLLDETARLKQKLTEAAEAQCVICRDAKPSRAFVPCGHVCVCISCWDGFARNGGQRCPNCRRDVQFSFPVFI